MKATKKLLKELFKTYSDVVFKQHYGTEIPMPVFELTKGTNKVYEFIYNENDEKRKYVVCFDRNTVYNDKIEISIVLIHAMVDEYLQYTGFAYDEAKEAEMKENTVIYVLDNVFKIKTI